MDDKKLQVSITLNTIVTTLLVVGGAYLFWILRDLILLVMTAIVIASAIEPGVVFLIRRHIPRFVSALSVYIFVFGIVFALFYFLFPPMVTDAANFLAASPHLFNALNLPASFTSIANVTSLAGGNVQSFFRTLVSLQSAFSANAGGIIQLFFTFFGGLFSFILVIVLSFYFALQETGINDFLRLVMPARYEDYSVDLWKRAQRKIGLWMQGQILLSVIIGLLVYLGLLILGIPYALLLAAFTAVAEIIPIFGSLMASSIAVAVGYTTGGVALAAIVLGLYIVVNQFESNLIYPLIVKKVVGVPPLLVIVALIAGYTLAGFLGTLLSVPMAAVLLEVITDFDKRKHRLKQHYKHHAT